MMYVDADTLDSAGNRRDGSRFEDLILRVFDDEQAPSTFTVFEDDGTTRNSPSREIHVQARRDGQQIVLTVDSAGSVPGLANVRPLVVEVISAGAVSAVTVNGDALQQEPAVSRSQRGWATLDTRTVRACIPDADVSQPHTFSLEITGPAPAMAPCCWSAMGIDRLGADVYARFSPPIQTRRGPSQARSSIPRSHIRTCTRNHPMPSATAQCGRCTSMRSSPTRTSA